MSTSKLTLAFIIRTAFVVALLTVIYRETGWATTLFLSMVTLRFEIENWFFTEAFNKMKEKADA